MFAYTYLHPEWKTFIMILSYFQQTYFKRKVFEEKKKNACKGCILCTHKWWYYSYVLAYLCITETSIYTHVAAAAAHSNRIYEYYVLKCLSGIEYQLLDDRVFWLHESNYTERVLFLKNFFFCWFAVSQRCFENGSIRTVDKNRCEVRNWWFKLCFSGMLPIFFFF